MMNNFQCLQWFYWFHSCSTYVLSQFSYSVEGLADKLFMMDCVLIVITLVSHCTLPLVHHTFTVTWCVTHSLWHGASHIRGRLPLTGASHIHCDMVRHTFTVVYHSLVHHTFTVTVHVLYSCSSLLIQSCLFYSSYWLLMCVCVCVCVLCWWRFLMLI